MTGAVYTVRELNYSVRVLEVAKNGRPLCVVAEPTLDGFCLPAALSDDDVNGVSEAVFGFLIAEEQAQLMASVH